MDMAHHCKLGVLGALSLMPGELGEGASERYHRRRRLAAAPRAMASFEAALARLGPGDTVLDLGANVGQFAERLADTGARVNAFEPDPWTFGRLSERVGARPNVTLHHAAIGLEDGRLTLARHPDFERDREANSVATSAMWEACPIAPGEAFEVEQVSLPRILRTHGRVALVKMDIEGAEVPILEVLLRSPDIRRIGALFVETHEVMMPKLRHRIAALRRLAARYPQVNLDWQ